MPILLKIIEMRVITLLFLIVTISSYVRSQRSPEWIDCLSGEDVNAIWKTDTSLFIGTTGGLIEHELKTQKVNYSNSANSDLLGNQVQAVLRDTFGILWIQTSEGLNCVKGGTWRRFPGMDGLMVRSPEGYMSLIKLDTIKTWTGFFFDNMIGPNVNLGLILADAAYNPKNGDLWIAAFTFGIYKVFHWDGSTWNEFNDQNSPLPFSSYTGHNIAFDSQGRTILTVDKSLWIYDQDWSEVDITALMGTTSHVSALAVDQTDLIYILVDDFSSSGNDVLAILDNDVVIEKIELIQQDDRNPKPSQLIIGGDEILIGFDNQGCYSLKDQQWIKLETSQHAFQSNEMKVYRDIDSVNYLIQNATVPDDRRSIFSYYEGQWIDLNSNNFYSTKDLRDFRLLNHVGHGSFLHVQDSLYKKEGGNWVLYDVPDIAPDIIEQNSLIHFDQHGDRWLLELYNSVIFYEKNGVWTRYDYQEHGARSGFYHAMVNFEVANELWLSTYNGISIFDFDSNTWELLDLSNQGINGNKIELIYWNEMLYGISQDKFFTIDTGRNIEIITTVQDLNQEQFFSSIARHGESIGLGMLNAFALYNNGQFQVFDIFNSGMTNHLVSGQIQDENGNFWITTQLGGLAIYNELGVSKDLLGDKLTSVKTANSSEQILLYPNPASSECSIFVKEGEWDKMIINSVDGIEVMRRKLKPGISKFDVRHLSPGLYLIEVLDTVNGVSTTTTFLKL